MKNILNICTGNICRSPMAEALFQDAFKNKGYEISSAGLAALVGKPPAKYAQEVLLEKKNLDISQYVAKQITQQQLLQTKLILVMEQQQKKQLEFNFPILYGRVRRIGTWSGFDIPDPYTRPKALFEQTYILLERCVNDWSENLS